MTSNSYERTLSLEPQSVSERVGRTTMIVGACILTLIAAVGCGGPEELGHEVDEVSDEAADVADDAMGAVEDAADEAEDVADDAVDVH